MALQLRPNCEYCDKDLPPNATDARICSYECTFCADCADNKLHNVCPNCGGGFVPRPIRPATERRPGVCVAKQLPSEDSAFESGPGFAILDTSTRHGFTARDPWRCNFGRTANIATRTCRRIRRKRASAPTNARSARTAFETRLHNVCPNCGGGFAPRPIRPATERRPGVCVAKHPPSDKRVHLKYSIEDVAAHSAKFRDIAPEQR